MQASEGYLEQRLQDAQIPFAWMCRGGLCKCELFLFWAYVGKRGQVFFGGFWDLGFGVQGLGKLGAHRDFGLLPGFRAM